MEVMSGDERPGEIEVKLNKIEIVYLTERILNIPTRLPAATRKTIGEKILRRIWGANIRGDIETVKW